jgi:phage terminase large subunit
MSNDPILETEIFPAFSDFLQPSRFKVAWGGRGSAKTRQFVSILTNNVLMGWRLVCFREIMKSLEDSVYQEFVEEIERRNLNQYFDIMAKEIRCLCSNGVIKFDGLHRNQQKVKGYAGFDCAWVEEAANVSAESWKFLIPTLRKKGSEIWVSFNPESPLDDTYTRFVTESPYPEDRRGMKYLISKKINYTDNPRFPQELRDDMEIMKEDDYTLYLHVYEGMPVANSDLAIIKPEWVEAMEDIHVFLGIDDSGEVVNGFDVSDEGEDANAHIFAKGQIIRAAWEWKDNDPNSAAVTVWNRITSDHSMFGKIVYDNIGVGAGAKGELRQRISEYELKGKKAPEIEGFNAAGAVAFPSENFDESKTNKDMFANIKAQAWWRFREGAYNAWKARAGKSFDADKIISISSEIDAKTRNKLKAELSQPRREYVGGKVKVEAKDKMKKRGVKSPNLADAAIMCYAPIDTGTPVAIFGAIRRRR